MSNANDQVPDLWRLGALEAPVMDVLRNQVAATATYGRTDSRMEARRQL